MPRLPIFVKYYLYGTILAPDSVTDHVMKLDLNWINLLILFGAIQGLIFSIILLFNKKHPGARFLALFMFVLAYNGFETFNWSSGLDRYHIFFDLFSYIIIFAIGPSLYLYITSLLYPEQKLSGKKILAHYGLVIFQFASRLVILTYHILWINNIIDTGVHSSILINIVLIYSEPLSVLVFLAYLVASILKFRKYGTTQIKSISKEGQQTIHKWIRALLFCVTILGIAWPLTILAPYFFTIPYDQHYYPIEIGLVFFIYWAAITGYHRTNLIYLKSSGLQANPVTAAESEKFLSQLRQAMETDKLYLDPELNLIKVASHTGINQKTISAILNQYHQTNFNDFINEYRVREVSERLIDPANQHLTISGIALESGFNSQATFQRAFKNSTGKSPREYMSLRLKKIA